VAQATQLGKGSGAPALQSALREYEQALAVLEGQIEAGCSEESTEQIYSLTLSSLCNQVPLRALCK
jgi:hypothetical protein